MAAPIDLSSLEKDPRLFLYTSLTAGSSHIITATSRMETILKANKIPFQAIDTATDEKARRLWQRRAGKRKLPGLVKEGYVLGDLEEIEEWNEFGELKENIGPVPANNAAPSGGQTGVNIAPPIAVSGPGPTLPPFNAPKSATGAAKESTASPMEDQKRVALPGAAEIAARSKALAEKKAEAAKEALKPTEEPKKSTEEAPKAEETATKEEEDKPVTAPKETTISFADEVVKQKSGIDHLSAPASALHSGTATPAHDAAATPSILAASSTATKSEKEASTEPEADAAAEPPLVKLSSEEETPAKLPEPSLEGKEKDIIKTEPAAADEKAADATDSKKETEEKSVEPKKTAEKETEAAKSEVTDPAANEESLEPSIESTTSGVKDLALEDEEKTTQEQSAKDGEEAAKSVED